MCADCGASLEGRYHNVYLCLPCGAERERIRKRRIRLAIQADPLRAARRRKSNRESAKAHYVPRTGKAYAEPCQATGCRRTFTRVWGASRRTMCDDCQAFYARETNAAGARRRRAQRKGMRRAA